MSLRHYLDRGRREVHSHLRVRVFGRFVFFFFFFFWLTGLSDDDRRLLFCAPMISSIRHTK